MINIHYLLHRNTAANVMTIPPSKKPVVPSPRTKLSVKEKKINYSSLGKFYILRVIMKETSLVTSTDSNIIIFLT